jgi:hypothetical protein
MEWARMHRLKARLHKPFLRKRNLSEVKGQYWDSCASQHALVALILDFCGFWSLVNHVDAEPKS